MYLLIKNFLDMAMMIVQDIYTLHLAQEETGHSPEEQEGVGSL
jgi:hypothetical protein